MSRPKQAPEHVEELRRRLALHAREIVRQKGPQALTMRALASEAGCAVGLTYRVFADRAALIAAIVEGEIPALVAAVDALEQDAGRGEIADNLMAFADKFLASPAVPLANELMSDPEAREQLSVSAGLRGLAPTSFTDAIVSYLSAEKRAGRVEPTVDEAAFGYLLASTLHNLLVAGPAWQRPSSTELRDIFVAVSNVISKT